MNNYLKEWCDERHQRIDKEFSEVWAKVKSLEGKLWSILVMLAVNIGIGVLALLMKG